jgi:hypothetical protein
MFYKNKIKIEKIIAEKELKIAMISKSDILLLKPIKTDSGVEALIQTSVIKSVVQEKKGWYYDDLDRDTLLITFFDGTWERFDMLVSEFNKQTGFKIFRKKNDSSFNDKIVKQNIKRKINRKTSNYF